ncbi:peroxisomal sarcosine oxidase-like isoform X2 [Oscarella lobularis]|uniref:peroxisomal sarcosine oxidase-like isoform X2 n=1 Tax=Oscarella lobularis TaxID=121494 RepID=UPI003313822F
MSSYDVIVVGAGIQGSSTAYTLAKRGQKTLLIEQFDRLHTRGSSHGASRITRMAYNRPYYVAMMKDAFPMWESIERESGKKLFTPTGLLTEFHKPKGGGMHQVEASLRDQGIPMELLCADRLRKRYPQMRFDDDMQGVVEQFAGVLRADLARETIQDLFIRHGGIIKTNESVIDIEPGSMIRVRTQKGDYFTQKLVLTVGPWASRVLKPLGLDLPLQVTRIRVLYWKTDGSADYSVDSFPNITSYDVNADHCYYGLPVLEYPGLFKLCCHSGTKIESPDERDMIADERDLEFMKNLVRTRFKGLSPVPVIIENCMYTMKTTSWILIQYTITSSLGQDFQDMDSKWVLLLARFSPIWQQIERQNTT